MAVSFEDLPAEAGAQPWASGAGALAEEGGAGDLAAFEAGELLAGAAEAAPAVAVGDGADGAVVPEGAVGGRAAEVAPDFFEVVDEVARVVVALAGAGEAGALEGAAPGSEAVDDPLGEAGSGGPGVELAHLEGSAAAGEAELAERGDEGVIADARAALVESELEGRVRGREVTGAGAGWVGSRR